MKDSIRYALVAGLITAGLLKAVPAFAEPVAAEDSVVTIVRTTDLNLAREEGRQRLDRRLAQAAREVCGTASDTDLQGKNDVRQCRDETLARAHARRDQLIATGEQIGVIAVSAAR